ncbi:CopY/TcrY family copper transport repressor [Enterococcus nangangensis]|uniref:CopY/TcrY family copper transport repressor n=1 Tax=Enterococcus nangangensis TaxID=2559926 RepID=UPI0010F8F010|nr:CopY/TcrY family copper transport repressor [Enterococcus nangangensis]
MEQEGITKAEWEIMRVIWTQHSSTSREIGELLKDKLAWQPSTVKTLLNRLVEKDFLQTEKVGKSFIYTAKISEEDSTQLMSHEVSQKLCAKKIPQLLAYLIAENDLTLGDIINLQEQLENKKAEAVTAIACNCVKRGDACQC